MSVVSLKKKKFTLKEFVWFGFNYTTFISFLGGLALAGNKTIDNKPNPAAIGMNGVWVFLVVGFFASLCAWSFAKMARVHNSNNNGGAYIYSRSTFGKFPGYMTLIMQYIGLPFLITLQIMFLMKGSFNTAFSHSDLINVKWGPFTNLWLDLIGIIIYACAASVVFLGIKFYKRATWWSIVCKWVTAALLIIAALYLCISNNQFGYWTKSIHNGGGNQLTLKGFITVFNAFFFYFAGFEIFSTAGRNIENPQKNIGKGIIIIMFLCAAFYAIVSIIFYGAFQTFSQNQSIGAWNKFKNLRWLEWSGIIIMIISNFALKIQIAMMNGLYGGTLLQPLAKEGFIPRKIRVLNKDNIPFRASLINLGFTACLLVLWLLIPDIIEGVKTIQIGKDLSCTTYNIPGYNWNMFTSASGSISIIIFSVIVFAVLWLAVNGKMGMRLWEWILIPLTAIVLMLLAIFHYYNVINNFWSQNWIASLLEFIFIGAAIIIAIILYFFYYQPIYKKRLKTNPEMQIRLEREFQLVDDWNYVSHYLENELNKYIERNKAIHSNKPNSNYKYAKVIEDQLQRVIQENKKQVEDQIKHDNDIITEE